MMGRPEPATRERAGRGRAQPERTCVGCRTRSAKQDLVRVVRRADGSVAVDPTGRQPGRGAYVHPRQECVRRAARGRSLVHALRTSLDRAEAARLLEEITRTVGERR